jgi:hypothetical protein
MPEPQYTPEELAQERWLPATGYEGLYSVSDLGRVRREAGTYGCKNGRILKHALTLDGYHFIGMSKNNKSTQYYVHKLVATLFIPNPNELREADHEDRDHDNNRASNLRWATGSQNNANQRGKVKSTSKYKGVCYYSVYRCWVASSSATRPKRIGQFRSEIAAALAYDHATRPLYGEFAFDNSKTFGLAGSVDEELEIINRDRIRKTYPKIPITDSDAIAIRTGYKAAPTTATEIELSERYGRSVSTIRDIRKGRTFKHLPLC